MQHHQSYLAAAVEHAHPVASTSAVPFAPPLTPAPTPTSTATTAKSINLTKSKRAAGKAPASAHDAQDSAASESSAPVKRRRKPSLKTFRCTGYGDCNMAFSRSEHLARHVRKHTGERPFVCHCGREFTRLDNVRQHAATVHSKMTEVNQEMLTRLANLHEKLSASTQQRQRDAGMVVPEEGDRARRGSRSAASTSADPPSSKGKKEGSAARPKPKPRASEQASQEVAALPHATSGGTAYSTSYADTRDGARHATSFVYDPNLPPGGFAPDASRPHGAESGAVAFSPAPLHHQEIYGAMAPSGADTVYPGMEYYSGSTTGPAYEVPAAVAPPERYEQYHELSPAASFIPPPPQPAAAPAVLPADLPADIDPISGGRVSLPSISALLPARAAIGESRQSSAAEVSPHPSLPAHGGLYAPEQRVTAYQPSPSPGYENPGPAPIWSYGGTGPGPPPPSRPPSHLDMPRQPQQPQLQFDETRLLPPMAPMTYMEPARFPPAHLAPQPSFAPQHDTSRPPPPLPTDLSIYSDYSLATARPPPEHLDVAEAPGPMWHHAVPTHETMATQEHHLAPLQGVHGVDTSGWYSSHPMAASHLYDRAAASIVPADRTGPSLVHYGDDSTGAHFAAPAYPRSHEAIEQVHYSQQYPPSGTQQSYPYPSAPSGAVYYS